jgi:hypothetical protein
MERPYRPPNVLRLFGISLKKDYVPVEDLADERLNTEADDCGPGLEGAAPESIYPDDKIPYKFTGLEDWPYSTNLHCWQCSRTHADRPKFLPTYLREAENECGIEIGVCGTFCSFACVALWITIHFTGKEELRWRAQDNLCLVYRIFTGHFIDRIRPAPHITELRRYGGDLDDDAFSKKMRDIDPLAGVRDHTPGSIVPERNRVAAIPENVRIKSVLTTLRSKGGNAKHRLAQGDSLAVGPKSIWGICGAFHEAELPPAADLTLPPAADLTLPPAADLTLPPAADLTLPPAAPADPCRLDNLYNCEEELEALLTSFDGVAGAPPLPTGLDICGGPSSTALSNDDIDALFTELGAI